MFIKKIIIIVGLCALFASCSTSRYAGNASETVREAESTTDIGVRYLLGRGVKQSDEKAFYYFSEAAKEGDPFAENELAFMYAAGKGTRRDYAKAIHWYTEAANHGLASAQYNLGLMYKVGLGVPPNRTLAMQWFQKSASHGFEPARLELAR